ncbi:hypothetical protein OOZ63_17730 [Paucibacter sp. PLA-PC-4]|uniref:hypothetical protein n=1 Tax=Paucibacter sp. PLA-PC-4 TaxID=2993655 RepID=UPI00224A8E7B|nr:hypothetical protein [Paucibacter sp. PLA-PC-4]MCX2863673.1 hypothetical protein [Paucibacter sp. PLA-PC-4]
MAAPPPYQPGSDAKKLQAIDTAHGTFALCSFDFLALAEWNPQMTKVGIRIARPEMLALANMLHHPTIVGTLIAGTTWKRSNKDLGRVSQEDVPARHDARRRQGSHSHIP